MVQYSQANRWMSVTTPLGPNMLFVAGFHGREAISELFRFELDLLAETGTTVPFESLLGKSVTIELAPPGSPPRVFSGILSKLRQEHRDATFTHYRAELVPPLWLRSLNRRSRIFQQQSVPEILRQVLEKEDAVFELRGKYYPHNYCAQYRESDFAFVSRLMEEEGIYYYFKHTKDGCQLVVADTSAHSPPLEGGSVLRFEHTAGGAHGESRIDRWSKEQSLRAGMVSLSDYSFELPQQDLLAEQSTLDRVSVGTVSHSLHLESNASVVIADYPGAYAHRHDGIAPGGGPQSDVLENVFADRTRTAKIRMEQETAQALSADGASDCGHLAVGHKFTLSGHFNGDGDYLLTAVEHSAKLNTLRSEDNPSSEYSNRFVCVPIDLPYRPPQRTPIPVVRGSQTATVVGPEQEEIWTDKYGRIKVRFHWDRQEGIHSCWVRVAHPWAGKGWGMVSLPRVGQEVVVDFLEGDPDCPLVTGSVYNAEQTTPYPLPAKQAYSGIKSHSQNGDAGNFSEIRFEDTKGEELFHLHAERDMSTEIENNHSIEVGKNKSETIGADFDLITKSNKHEQVHGSYQLVVGGGAMGVGSGAGGSPFNLQDDVPMSSLPNLNVSTPWLTTTVGFLNEQLCLGEQTAFVVGAFLNLSFVCTIEVFLGVQLEVRYPSFTEIHDGVVSLSFLKSRFTETDKTEVAAGNYCIGAGTGISLATPSALEIGAGDITATTPGAFLLSADTFDVITGGPASITSGGDVTITAPSITLTCGDSTLSITPTGITLNAPKLAFAVDSQFTFNGMSIFFMAGQAVNDNAIVEYE